MANDATSTLRNRLRERLEKTGKTPHAVSVEIGANRGYVRDILDPDKTGMPSGTKIKKLAKALDTTTEYLLGDAASAEQVGSEVGVGEKLMPWRGPESEEPGIPLVGTGDCAELSVTDSETGQTIAVERCSFDPEYHVRYVSRPPALRGARELYAIYFHGSSMEPRFEAGEVGIVDPQRPPRPGDYVLVQLNNGESEDVVSVLVKRLVRQTGRSVELEQFNPPLTFSLDRQRVARIHRIMPQTDLLFG